MSPLVLMFFHLFLLLSWQPLLALSFSTISHLPGFRGPLPFHLETGYVSVDDGNGVQLFYYFFKSEGNPSKDPLLLWLTGGPGCSVLSGLAFGIGPFEFEIAEYNGSVPNLKLNPYSWTKFSNIIFLDSPVGTGFSFSRMAEGHDGTGDISSTKQAYKFLREWFVDHPEFLSNPLYIGGDSYAGKVTPIIAQIIAQGIEDGHKPLLNLKGYLIGNPGTGERCDRMSRFQFSHSFGIISNEFYKSATINCEGQYYERPNTADCARDIKVLEKFLSEISTPYILDAKCDDETLKPDPDKVRSRRSLEEELKGIVSAPKPPPLWCRAYGFYLSYQWANSGVTRETLGIQKGTIGEWERCSSRLNYSTDIRSSIPYQKFLNNKGYRALVYSGDHDSIVPFTGTLEWIGYLNLSAVDDWRSWSVDDQVAGYTRTYSNNFTFATVKGGAHQAMQIRPEECSAMFQRWISHNPL